VGVTFYPGLAPAAVEPGTDLGGGRAARLAPRSRLLPHLREEEQLLWAARPGIMVSVATAGVASLEG